MAGQAHLIEVDERAAEWALLLDVAQTVPSERWALVGGLMVHAHAIRAGITPPRHTSDLDVLINIGAARISQVAGPLQAAGFEPVEPNGAGPFHRFKRGHDVVDVMVPHAADRTYRWRMRPVLRSPGAQQALQRLDQYTVTATHGGASALVNIPDPTGAIIAKAAAYTVDPRDRERHLEDVVVLLAATQRRDLSTELSRRDRQHLRPMIQKLSDPDAIWWSVVDDRERGFADATFRRLRELVES